MTTIKQRVERSLDALDAGHPLVRLVDDILREYPEPYALATEHARRIVLQRTGKAIDPRFIWWHQFSAASSSPRTFSGWEHAGPPLKSMVLTELVIQRFDGRYQLAPDLLDQEGGFYRQGAHASLFNEFNEVPMLGSAVQRDLWSLDFATTYRNAVQAFWSSRGQDFRVLAKINLLAQANIALRKSHITADDLTYIRRLVSDQLDGTRLPTLTDLQREGDDSVLSVRRYAIDRTDRGCLYSLHAADGRVLLYLPWATEGMWGFESELAMAAWLRTRLQNSANLEAFAQAAHVDPRDASRTQAMRTHLTSIADSHSEQAARTLLGYLQRSISGNLFVYMAERAGDEMRQNADLMIDNTELRKAMWNSYLAAYLKVFGGFAPLGWPITLTLLGASIIKLALDVDAAASAHDDRSRQAALREALLDAVFAALNMVDLSFQSSFASLSREVPFNERSISLSDWQAVQSPSEQLQGYEANQLLNLQEVEDGRLRGVRLDDDGACWIVIDGLSYRVRYSHELAVWLVVSPDNPYAFAPLQPVRLDEQGVWRLLAAPRLAAGAPPAIEGMAEVDSTFWNTYLKVDEAKSKSIAVSALRRQKDLLRQAGVEELAEGTAPSLDPHGLDCVMVGGVTHYSYRYRREYYNSLIEYYTNEESNVNDVFRSGLYKFEDEDDYLATLADNLELLPKDNTVNLYRGGHGSRGTGSARYRAGQLRVGDVLINTDFTSFTENPYKVGEFASTRSTPAADGMVGVFDDSSIIFELPAGTYQDGTPISAFSLYWDESETLFVPGRYFRIDKLEQVYGEHYQFIHVMLSQVTGPVTGELYDLRTGELFERSSFVARIRTPALAQRFFPAPD